MTRKDKDFIRQHMDSYDDIRFFPNGEVHGTKYGERVFIGHVSELLKQCQQYEIWKKCKKYEIWKE